MKRNLTALFILVLVQLGLWKIVPMIDHIVLSDTKAEQNTTKSSTVSHITTLKGHALKVTSAAITADNNRIISGSEDNTIKVWNFRSSQLERTLSGHTGVVNYLSVTPDGKHIVSADSGSVRIWNLQTGALIRKLENSGTIRFVRTSKDGRTLVMDGGTQIEKIQYNKDGYIYSDERKKYLINVVNLKTGTNRKLVHKNLLTQVKISSSGNILVTGDNEGKLNIWNLRSGKLQKKLIGHETEIKSIAISPDEKTIVSTEDNGQIKIWDLISGKMKITFTGHNYSHLYPVRIVIPNNNTLVSWNKNNKAIKIWNLQNGNLKHTIKPLKDSREFYSITFNGKNIMTEEYSGIQIWDVLTGKLRNTLEIKDDILAFSPDGKTVATRIEDNNINIWRITSGN
ncbi:MAG: WD40 repeat domain-containing protein [Calothrix sp. MO_192.B10]|nr:WD40 repeat domain-containing protein [Calothrix sp. MO_192.B10]